MEYKDRSGKIFIAYKGYEISQDSIRKKIWSMRPSQFDVKVRHTNSLIFAKIGHYRRIGERDPLWNHKTGILTVSGYNQDEIERTIEEFDSPIRDRDSMHRFINYMYADYSTNMFQKLSNYMHFCSVIWDQNKDSIIAGITESNGEYTHLYYGYTPKNNELIFSNAKEAISDFVDEVFEMDNNTYMQDGILYSLDGTRINKKREIEQITKDKKNEKYLIDRLYTLLMQVINDETKDKIEKNIEEYLSSGDFKKRIEDFLSKELDIETQRNVLEIIKQTIQDYSIENNVRDTLNDVFNDVLENYSKSISVPMVNIIKLKDTVLGQTQVGFYHERFEQILTQIQLDEPIMLIGPAGSGKNVAISQVSNALGLHMYYTNNASNEFKLTGFIDAGGNYRDTEFYKAFKNGGVFFLDEIDNSDPSALIVINSALANGYMAFPHETINRHPDFRMVAAANTWGKGADLQYVGRNTLDAATLDRFDNIFFDYDKKLEQALYPSNEVLEFMWAFRDAIYQSKISHIVSTRGIGKVYKKDINGIPVEDILTSNVIKNLGQDDINIIIGNMKDVSLDNKYLEGIKRLRLHR